MNAHVVMKLLDGKLMQKEFVFSGNFGECIDKAVELNKKEVERGIQYRSTSVSQFNDLVEKAEERS